MYPLCVREDKAGDMIPHPTLREITGGGTPSLRPPTAGTHKEVHQSHFEGHNRVDAKLAYTNFFVMKVGTVATRIHPSLAP